MLTHLTNTTKSIVFYAIALALALIAARQPGITPIVYMFTPLAATALMLFVVTRDGYTRAGWATLGLHRLGRAHATPADHRDRGGDSDCDPHGFARRGVGLARVLAPPTGVAGAAAGDAAHRPGADSLAFPNDLPDHALPPRG